MPSIKIENFIDGINNWLEPHLIKPNECVDLVNAEIKDGTLNPVNGLAVLQDQPAILAYLTPTRSVVKWNNIYYWSDNETGALNSSLGYMGITPPSTQPEIAFGDRGNRFAGVYQYICTFETNDGWESAPYELSATTKSATVNAASDLTTVDLSVVPMFATRSADYKVGDRVQYGGAAYECIIAFKDGGAVSNKNYPGGSNNRWMSIDLATVTSTGYNSLILTLPVPAQSIVTKINIYRTIENYNDFYFIDQVPVSQSTYTDTTSDESLVLNEEYQLNEIGAPLPVYDGSWQIKGGKYLTEVNGIFYLAYENRVYQSEQNDPNSWNPLKVVIAPDTVTGIAKDSNGVLVFTRNRTYSLTQSALATSTSSSQDILFGNMAFYDLRVSQGCPNWRTIAYFRNTPVWVSNDGVCIYQSAQQLEGKFVQVITEGKYNVEDVTICAAISQNEYWLFTDAGVVVFDFKAGLRITRRDTIASAAYYDEENDRLLVMVDAVWYYTDGGAVQTFSYTSPEFNMGSELAVKRINRLSFDGEGEFTMAIKVDGESRATMTLDGTGHRDRRFPAGLRGERFQFVITGTSRFRGYEVDFVVMTGGR